MPSSQANQLEATFDTVTGYQQDTDNVRVDVAGDTATAHATVARHITPLVGVPFDNVVETEFRLRRSGATWIIVNVNTR